MGDLIPAMPQGRPVPWVVVPGAWAGGADGPRPPGTLVAPSRTDSLSGPAGPPCTPSPIKRRQVSVTFA